MPQCPYAKHDNNAMPIYKNNRLYATCPICGLSARASSWQTVDGKTEYSLSKAGRAKGEPSKVYSKRLLEHEVKLIEQGKAFLTISNNCLQLQYIP